MLESLVGRRRARAESWILTESAQKKTPEVAVVFRLSEEAAEGATVTWHGYLTDNAFARTIESLRYCGWKGDDLADIQGLGTNEVELDIQEEEYNGTLRPKVQWVNRLGGIFTEPMSTQRAKQFAAQVKGQIRALDAEHGWNGATKAASSPKAPSGTKRQKEAAAAETHHDPGPPPETPQDDIPF